MIVEYIREAAAWNALDSLRAYASFSPRRSALKLYLNQESEIMKRLAIIAALVAVGACQKPAQQPASNMSADTTHAMAADTTKKMGDTSHMTMAPATTPAKAPATAPAPKKP
jgi:hypothetical protein